MGIFFVAALAGFLLLGWSKASQEKSSLSLKPWVQGVLGLLVFYRIVAPSYRIDVS